MISTSSSIISVFFRRKKEEQKRDFKTVWRVELSAHPTPTISRDSREMRISLVAVPDFENPDRLSVRFSFAGDGEQLKTFAPVRASRVNGICRGRLARVYTSRHGARTVAMTAARARLSRAVRIEESIPRAEPPASHSQRLT